MTKVIAVSIYATIATKLKYCFRTAHPRPGITSIVKKQWLKIIIENIVMAIPVHLAILFEQIRGRRNGKHIIMKRSSIIKTTHQTDRKLVTYVMYIATKHNPPISMCTVFRVPIHPNTKAIKKKLSEALSKAKKILDGCLLKLVNTKTLKDKTFPITPKIAISGIA
jgi:hypothetical protein